MPYILYKSNGKILATIQDGNINTSSTPLTFVGRNYAGYGEILNQNIVKILENFANTSSPATPMTGQLWYDTANQVLTIYNGTNFKSLATFGGGSITPINSVYGDLWFNDFEQILYFYNGTKFIPIGPANSSSNQSSAVATTALDVNGNSHYVMGLNITDDSGLFQRTVAVISDNNIQLNIGDPLFDQNYTVLKRGITLPTSDLTNGNSISSLSEGAYYFWGTAATARGLVYATTAGQPAIFHPAEDFFLYQDWINALAHGLYIQNYYGIHIGDVTQNGAQGLQLHTTGPTNGYIGQLSNWAGSQLDFEVENNGILQTTLSIAGSTVQPGLTNGGTNNAPVSVDLGTNINPFANLYVNNVTNANFKSNSIVSWNISSTGTITGNISSFNTLAATNIVNNSFSSVASTVTYLTVVQDASIGNNLNITGDITHVNKIQSGGDVSFGGILSVTGQGRSSIQGTLNVSGLITGNVHGNIYGAYSTATYAILDNITSLNGMIVQSAGNITTPKIYAPGGANSSPGDMYGAWTLHGSMASTDADIAERYHADRIYEYGTVLVVGGKYEVTTTTNRASVNIAGVVSERPAYKMNQTAGPDTTHPFIALKGRIPCKVVGIIHKGDRLVTSSRPGYAEVFQQGDSANAVIGIALEDNLSDVGNIEIKV